MSQAAVSQLEMVVVLSLLFSKTFVNCTNSIGVCSKNCLMCSFNIRHTCRGVFCLVDHSDLSFAMDKTVPSFVITSVVESLGMALGSWAGSLGMARGSECRSIPWWFRRCSLSCDCVGNGWSQNRTMGLLCSSWFPCGI